MVTPTPPPSNPQPSKSSSPPPPKPSSTIIAWVVGSIVVVLVGIFRDTIINVLSGVISNNIYAAGRSLLQQWGFWFSVELLFCIALLIFGIRLLVIKDKTKSPLQLQLIRTFGWLLLGLSIFSAGVTVTNTVFVLLFNQNYPGKIFSAPSPLPPYYPTPNHIIVLSSPIPTQLPIVTNTLTNTPTSITTSTSTSPTQPPAFPTTTATSSVIPMPRSTSTVVPISTVVITIDSNNSLSFLDMSAGVTTQNRINVLGVPVTGTIILMPTYFDYTTLNPPKGQDMKLNDDLLESKGYKYLSFSYACANDSNTSHDGQGELKITDNETGTPVPDVSQTPVDVTATEAYRITKVTLELNVAHVLHWSANPVKGSCDFALINVTASTR